MSPAKALRRALSRTADVLWDLALVTQEVTVEMLDQDGVIEKLPSQDLLMLLDGPDGALGLATVDRDVLTGIVEVQTIQQVTQMPVDQDRVLTQTDSAMMAPLLDGTLSRMFASLEGNPMAAQLEGFAFGAMLEDARSASLLLEAAAYRSFNATVDLALGRRKGQLRFILPDRKPGGSGGRRASDANMPGPYADLLERVPARLDAVLTRITLPLNRANELQVGHTLKLAPDALDKVEITAGRTQLVARGRLGQLNGCRAVRLTWPVIGPGGGPALGAAAGMGLAGAGVTDGSLPEADFAAAGGASDLPQIDMAQPEAAMADLAGDLSDAPMGDMVEELPDLPPMDFESDAADFDIDNMDFGGDSEGGDGDFAMAPMDIDFND